MDIFDIFTQSVGCWDVMVSADSAAYQLSKNRIFIFKMFSKNSIKNKNFLK